MLMLDVMTDLVLLQDVQTMAQQTTTLLQMQTMVLAYSL
jgi:hypothetical protein